MQSFNIRNDIQKAIIDAGASVGIFTCILALFNPIEHKLSQAKRKKMETGYDMDSLFSVHMM